MQVCIVIYALLYIGISVCLHLFRARKYLQFTVACCCCCWFYTEYLIANGANNLLCAINNPNWDFSVISFDVVVVLHKLDNNEIALTIAFK